MCTEAHASFHDLATDFKQNWIPSVKFEFPNIKVKVKLALEQAPEAQRGSRGVVLLFL
jgi:hypothetical protein